MAGGRVGPRVMRMREQAMFIFFTAALGKVDPAPRLGGRVELPLMAFAGEAHQRPEIRRANWLSSSDTSQAQTQGFELTLPNIFPTENC